MIDSKYLEDLIEVQIKDAVNQQVKSMLDNPDWIQSIEKKVTTYVQDRITARFSNIGTLPDLVEAVKNSVVHIMDQGVVPGIDHYVDQAVVKNAVDHSVEELVQRAIDELTVDPNWLAKIENLINQEMVRKVAHHLSLVDLDKAVAESVEKSLSRVKRGIADVATKTELTVMDETVVAENELVSRQLTVEQTAQIKGALTVQDLIVKGTVNTDNLSWKELADHSADIALSRIGDQWKQELVDQVLELAKTHGLDFAQVNIGGHPLFSGQTLSPAVKDTSIESTGILRELAVAGRANINDTVHVISKRLGINTDQPEMALGVWDEEVSMVVGKLSNQHGFIGTGRKQALSIGVNRVPQIEIDADGITTIKQLKLGRYRIGYGNEVPGYSGTKGDIVFNNDPKPDAPFAWICLGAFRWQPLRSA